MGDITPDPIEPTDPTVLDSGVEGLEPAAEPPADPEPTEPPADPPADPPLRGKDAPPTQERIDELYGQKMRAEREVARLKREAAQPATVPELGQQPREEDFENYTDFVRADRAYDNKKSVADGITESNKQNQENYDRGVEEVFQANITTAEKTDPEFRSKILHPAFKPLIYDSEKFAEIVTYLHENPGETERLLSLPTINHAAREFGKIEASLSKPKPRTESNAPDATKPVGTGTPPSVDPENMKEADYMVSRTKTLYPGRGG